MTKYVLGRTYWGKKITGGVKGRFNIGQWIANVINEDQRENVERR